jgi:hypothetical protein
MRSIGITTKQMKNAPEGAYYIWVNNMFGYPKNLAREIGRKDLKIVGPAWLLDRDHFRGGITAVVDHACDVSSKFRIKEGYEELMRVLERDLRGF